MAILRASLGAVAGVLVFSDAALGQAFYLTGIAPGPHNGSRAYGLSADGTVAVGSSGAAPSAPGFIWTAAGGRYDFGFEPGVPTVTAAYAISGDGGTVVGEAFSVPDAVPRAFRWRGPGTFESLGSFSFYNKTFAQGVSGDGSVIVGRGEAGLGGFVGQAFRWTEATGMQGLGFTRANHSFSEAQSVSRDGSTIVGISRGADFQAFRWTSQSGMQELPALPGSSTNMAVGVNFDGSIIVGTSGDTPLPAVWANGQLSILPLPAGFFHGIATSVNDDGSVITGLMSNQGTTAFIWTPSTGMERLSDYLALHGVTVPAGINLRECVAVSQDGTVFAGWTEGAASQGFIAVIPAPGLISTFSCGLVLIVGRRRWRSSAVRGGSCPLVQAVFGA